MTIKAMTTTATAHDPMSKQSADKKWWCATLAAAALTLGACADKEAPMTEAEPAADAQTPVEQAGTGVASADTATATANDDVAIASANEGVATDSSTDMPTDDVGIATADDSEMLDGTKTEEQASTY